MGYTADHIDSKLECLIKQSLAIWEPQKPVLWKGHQLHIDETL
jgi:hypothetical protein